MDDAALRDRCVKAVINASPAAVDAWIRPVVNAVLAAITAAGYELHPVGTGETLARLRAVAIAAEEAANETLSEAGEDSGTVWWNVDEDPLRALGVLCAALTDAELGREP